MEKEGIREGWRSEGAGERRGLAGKDRRGRREEKREKIREKAEGRKKRIAEKRREEGIRRKG